MAAVVYQKNAKTGVTYVYESISHWDKEKRQSRAVRKCIGKLDPSTNEIIPTRKRKRKIEPEDLREQGNQVPCLLSTQPGIFMELLISSMK
jgi:hypothetical protein